MRLSAVRIRPGAPFIWRLIMSEKIDTDYLFYDDYDEDNEDADDDSFLFEDDDDEFYDTDF